MRKKIRFTILGFLCSFYGFFLSASPRDSLAVGKVMPYYPLEKSFSKLVLESGDHFYEAPKNVDPALNKQIAMAQEAFAYVDQKNAYAGSIEPHNLTELPVGVQERGKNAEYSIVVTKARFTPDYTIVDVYARMKTPEIGLDGEQKTLYFGAEGVKISYSGNIVGEGKLSLLGNIEMLFNRNKWMMTLEGGFINKADGNTINDNTYVVIDCKGVKEISLKGSVEISRELLLPVDAQGEIAPEIINLGNRSLKNRVRGAFLIKAEDWNDLLAEVSLSPFAITAEAKNKNRGYFVFSASQVILDMSDRRNHPDMIFPRAYLEKGYLMTSSDSWRGLFIRSLKIGLPKEFKTTESKRIAFEAQNLIIDDYGVSGNFSAQNLFPLEKGRTGGEGAWSYSLDKISIEMLASKIVGGDFEGMLQLPVARKNSKKSLMGYRGRISEEDYIMRVITGDAIDFDVWGAKASIDPGSLVEFQVKNGEFFPKAVLNGHMDIAPSNKESDENEDPNQKKILSMKGIRFQGLTLQTQAPFVSVDYFGAEGTYKLAGFPLSINNIALVANESHVGLRFGVSIGFEDQGFSASGNLIINGEILLAEKKQQWRYKNFSISGLRLNQVDVKVAKISGELKLMQDDPLYGEGFKASLKAKIEGIDIEVSAKAVFGYSTFRYWGFQGSVDGLNIPATLITINGFTGGAFYRMTPTNPDPKMPDRNTQVKDRAKSVMEFMPDESMALTLKAGVYGFIRKKEIASFMAGFDIITNKTKGLAYIGFTGEAWVMDDFSKNIPDPFGQVSQNFEQILKKEDWVEDLKQGKSTSRLLNLNEVEKNYPVAPKPSSAVYAKMVMSYDFNNSIFHADLDGYINVGGGLITGIGHNGSIGRSSIHLAPNEWYLHMGTSERMMGIKVGVGALSVESRSYLMVGDRIGASPPPPPEVSRILGLEASNLDYMKNLNQLSEGRGFAFGAHLAFDTGDMNALLLYARFQAGVGADIMLKNYGEARCSNRGGQQIGINGWYANGQAYVYLAGELGIRVKLFFIDKKIPIVKAGAAALLQIRAPNPFWMRGYLGGYYDLLGGMIKGSFRFKLEFGEECKLENASVLGGMKIVSDLSPRNNETDRDVFTKPQATFSMKVNEPIVIEEEDGDHTYKILIEEFSVLDEKGNKIPGRIEYPAADIAEFVSSEVLPPSQKLKALVEVSFLEKRNGLFEVVTQNGKKATEREERVFTTGTAPNYIPMDNIEYAYPIPDQKYYHPEEASRGYIKLKRGQSYLFDDKGFETFTVFTSENKSEKDIPTDFNYNEKESEVYFTLPKLKTGKKYQLNILARSKKSETSALKNELKTSERREGEEKGDDSMNLVEITGKSAANVSQNGEIQRISFAFESSIYKSFAQKIGAIKPKSSLNKIDSQVLTLEMQMNAKEAFDAAELTGNKYTAGVPLIDIYALAEDAFAQKFQNLLYQDYPFEGIRLEREKGEEKNIGIPPIKALPILTPYLSYLGNSFNSELARAFPYSYDLFNYYNKDQREIMTKTHERVFVSKDLTRSERVKQILNSTYGVIPKGKYRVNMRYIMPGGKKGTEKNIHYER